LQNYAAISAKKYMGEGQINPPEVEKETLPTPKPVRRPLPRECRETRQERQLAKNRAPVICHSLADQNVIFDVPGLCYASFWVSVDGRPKDLQGFGCRHDVLLETARRAFKSRRYLPGLEDGRPVQKAVDAEICTHSELMTVASAAFKECEFTVATTDKRPVARPYMKHQIDIDVFDNKGEKIPVHPSFSDSSPHKPYITE